MGDTLVAPGYTALFSFDGHGVEFRRESLYLDSVGGLQVERKVLVVRTGMWQKEAHAFVEELVKQPWAGLEPSPHRVRMFRFAELVQQGHETT